MYIKHLNSIFYFCLIDEGTKGQELKKKNKACSASK